MLPPMSTRYEITERLATGGMAEIYKGKVIGADGFEKVVVIKRILPEYTQDPDFVGMFVREAKLSTLLNHPNIVQVFDLGKHGDEYFITMEYVDGPNLHATAVRSFKMGYKPFPLRECLFVMAEVCKGLDYAHRKCGADGQPLGIIHRDVSPPNILLSFDGTVKVADFGVAKARDQAVRTRTGVLKGKFGYMSPEQASGKPLDRRSDVFSLGVVLWELLAGKRLFKGQTPLLTVERVVRCEVPLLASFFPEIPPEVDALVAQALARDPVDRFQSAGEMGEAISDYLFAAGLKVSARDLSAFLRHIFLDEHNEQGEPVWRPSPMPKPLPKPPSSMTAAMARAGATVVDPNVLTLWQEEAGIEGTGGEPSYSDKPQRQMFSAKYVGGTLLQFAPVPGDPAPPRGPETPTVPVTSPAQIPPTAIPLTARRRQTSAVRDERTGTGAPESVREVPASMPLGSAAPPAEPTPRWGWVLWTLGALAIAGAMAALIYFSKHG
jgi:serine/threonine protein kinase